LTNLQAIGKEENVSRHRFARLRISERFFSEGKKDKETQ